MQVDIIVIGAGVVGLAITRKAALAGYTVLLIESNEGFGTQTSSRNSEVIHAGIYYPCETLKARLCVTGANCVYDYCALKDVPAQRIGKLIIATDEAEMPVLETLMARGKDNGAPSLELIGGKKLAALEPALKAVGGIYSPFTGIVDSHRLMAEFAIDAENAGATIVYQSRFEGAVRKSDNWHCRIMSQDELAVVSARFIINAAGHNARKVALGIDGLRPQSVPAHYMAKGQYFTSTRKPPFRHLIYPIPKDGGSGVHLTLDTGGGARFGPDIAWVDEMSYDVNPADAKGFHRDITRWWPQLKKDELVPAWAGVRPMIYPDGSSDQDFVVMTENDHGAQGVIGLYGIDSPGLTCSMVLAGYVLQSITTLMP